MTFTPEDTEKLKAEVKARLSEKRFMHTLGVSECALRLAELCAPAYKDYALAAGLLHDITKELSAEEQKELLSEYDSEVSDGILHSLTAPTVIKRDFPKYSDDIILNAVCNHTTGAPDMTLFDEIIFLADFIEKTRKYEASVKTREYVFSNMAEGEYEKNAEILHRACLMEIDSTLENLKAKNMRIDEKTLKTRDALLQRI